MSQINNPPVGLQAFLGNQNFGVNPSNLLRDVSGAIDLTPFLGAFQISYYREVSNDFTNGVKAPLVVPPGEAWLVLQHSFFCSSVPTTANYQLSTLFRNFKFAGSGAGLPNLEIPTAISGDFVTIAAQGQVGAYYNPSRPVVYPAGSQFAGRLSTTAAVPVACENMLQFYRLLM